MAANYSSTDSDSDLFPSNGLHIEHQLQFPCEICDRGLYFYGHPNCPRTFCSRSRLHHHCHLHHSLIFDGNNWVHMSKEWHQTLVNDVCSNNKKKWGHLHRHCHPHHQCMQELPPPAPMVLSIQTIRRPPPPPPIPNIHGRRTLTQSNFISTHTQTDLPHP